MGFDPVINPMGGFTLIEAGLEELRVSLYEFNILLAMKAELFL